MNTNFSQMAQEIMRCYGVTTYELASLIGTSQATAWRIATGDVQEPRYATCRRIVELYEQRPEAA